MSCASLALSPFHSTTGTSMSDDRSAGGGDQPPAKKQKRGDDDEDETTTEKFGGPIEDETTALQKLEQVGFDPDLLQIEYDIEVTDSVTWSHTPMEYFCRVGDLPMCRFLLSKGVATTGGREDDDEYEYWFPMLAAARGGHLDVCKWLCQFGARADLGGVNELGQTPLMWVCRRDSTHKSSAPYRNASGYFEVGKWLILEGAISDKDPGMSSDNSCGEI